jgi:Flp pilus assembly pilin Flp
MMQVVARFWLKWPFGCSHDGLMSEGNALVRRWLREEHGQDLIEYALLCSFIGFAGVVAFSFVSTAMNTSYDSWNNDVTGVQSFELVEVPDPVPAP